MRRAPALALCAVAALAAASPALAAQELWAIGSNIIGDSDVYRIDGYRTGTPTIEVIGDTGQRLDDIAIDPTDGRIYGVKANDDELYEIDPLDGSIELVGETGLGTPCRSVAIEFDYTGQLWAWCTPLGQLFRLDPDTGAAVAGATTAGFRASGDLAFDCEGRLWGTALDGKLVRFDLSTFGTGVLSAVEVGTLALPDGEPFGLEIDSNGRMYLGEGDNTDELARLWIVDPDTAAITLHADWSTFLGGTDGGVGLFGLSFTDQPEPIFASGFDLTGLAEWSTFVP